ncbi:MAG: riboflavin synthase subunit alpha [Oligoflexia bacterium]|nr:riboflavin synthase subunit alpha [Oligoflexia bacterium]
MFTGIVKGQGLIEEVTTKPGLHSIRILLPAGAEHELEVGASIAVDGVCLTVTQFRGRVVDFDVMLETLNRTTLGTLEKGSLVNIERAARDGQEVGGHAISGHIDCTAEIVKIEAPENNKVMTFRVEAPWVRYIFQKGYIALNGVSLTISGVEKQAGTFQVWFIPETLRLTSFAGKKIGDRINLEVERGTLVTVDTIRSYLDELVGPLLPELKKVLAEKKSTALDALS